jgi:cell division septation protein DedD
MGLITEERRGEVTSDRGLGRGGRMGGDEAEITLGMRSLLGIFFGLVLICGIFFGLGYSVGRSGGNQTPVPEDVANAAGNSNLKKPSATQSLTPAPPVPPAETTGEENSPAPVQSASAPAAEQPAPVRTVSAPQPKAAQPTFATAPVTRPAQPVTTPAPTPVRRADVFPATVTPGPSTAPARTVPVPAAVAAPMSAVPSGSFMVQIAAVRLQQDANVLVGALQRRGYSVVVRNESQDSLLHVQVGPFTSRSAAFAMRSRLLADGYNAVVK